jgi:thiol:disulfide interchange protein
MDHNIMMLLACVLAGYASTMNMWVDNWDDVRFSLNDFYMVGLMTGWMFFFMGLLTLRVGRALFGLILAVLFFVLIRTQAFVTEIQYLRGMIPHHSMAVMMSKQVEKEPNSISHLLDQIIQTQQKEIIIMKDYLASI